MVAFGVASSTAVHFLWPFPYTSKAEIMIRYVQDTTAPGVTDIAKPKFIDGESKSILNTEIKILTSRDLALQVATNIGPEKILGKSADTNNVNPAAAAAVIAANLMVEPLNNCDVIPIQYTGSDPLVVQQVLLELVSAYKSAYVQIHLSRGVSDDYLVSQTDKARTQFQDATRTLKQEKTNMGLSSLEDAKKNQANLIAKTLQIKEDLAEAESNVKYLRERVSGAMRTTSGTNKSTNLTAAAAPAPPSPDVVAKFQDLYATRSARRSKEEELSAIFMPNSAKVQSARKQREAAEADYNKFVAENPGVLVFKPNDADKPRLPGPVMGPTYDLNEALQEAEKKQQALLAKYNELTNQLAKLDIQAVALANGEEKIMQAQSEREIAEAKYRAIQISTAEQSINEVIANKVSNISVIEQPTPPARSQQQINKMTEGVLAFFLALAFGLPFLIELVFDQSLKSQLDVQARIDAPFFITMPRTNGRSLAALESLKIVPLLTANGSATPGPGAEDKKVTPPTNGQVAPWDERHELRPFFETLRDRLMTYFEMINLTHKPKLVAVTSCTAGAGVTTTAAGLASSLSEIGEGNVLLVNMNNRDGKAHHFYKGKLTCGIEDALEKEKREPSQVNDKLFVAKEDESDERLPRVLPKRFSHLVPMMKASDFDYIIFDMPPVSEISITPRLARFMDMVLLVIESGKTSRDAAARVASQLAETKTNVGLVLNKNRSYVPKRLEQRL